MASKKINALTLLGAAPATDDDIPMYDTSGNVTRRMKVSNLFTSPALVTPALGTPQSGNLSQCTDLPTAGLVANAVTNAKLAQMAQARVKGRAAAAGTGDPTDLTPDEVSTILAGATDPFKRSSLAGNIHWHPPATTSVEASTGTTIPLDNTAPQNTEGAEFITLEVTPRNASSTLVIEFDAFVGASAAGNITVALFVDSTADALAAVQANIGANTDAVVTRLRYIVAAGSTSARTYKIRFGPSAAITAYLLRRGSADLFDAAKQASLSVMEIMPAA
jgi:hypothetical protein